MVKSTRSLFLGPISLLRGSGSDKMEMIGLEKVYFFRYSDPFVFEIKHRIVLIINLY